MDNAASDQRMKVVVGGSFSATGHGTLLSATASSPETDQQIGLLLH
jgi:phosphopantetheine adenylyltransferase